MDNMEGRTASEGPFGSWKPPPLAVRWYSYRAPMTSKSMSDAPYIPHRGSLVRFCDADSHALENAYSMRAEELERFWWEEEAYAQAGPDIRQVADASVALPALAGAPTVDQSSRGVPAPDASPSWLDFMVKDVGEEVGIPVRSGQWEVDLQTRRMRPCYWPAPPHRVLRGTWFVEKSPGDWVPLREPLAEQLEQAFRSCVWDPSSGFLLQRIEGTQPERQLLAARLELNVAQDNGWYALFMAEDEAYLGRDAGFTWLRRLGGATLSGTIRLRLRRGYVAPATTTVLQREADVAAEMNDEAAAVTPPSHLLLVVHGIGQNLAGANIAQDAQNLRAGLRQIERDAAGAAAIAATPGLHSPSKAGTQPPPHESADSAHLCNRGTPLVRVEVVPVQWRKTVSLEVDALAAQLQPPGIPALRQVLHSTAVEVLLYLTPLHRAAVLGSLVTSLNSAHARFMLRNPEFSGPVSIIAHSLGSVLCWDILCNQPALHTVSPPLFSDASSSSSSTDVNAWNPFPVGIEPLNFTVDNLILAGSPLGCFLALRGVNQAHGMGLGTSASAALMRCHPGRPYSSDGMPAVRRVYHVYHPFDPVAYRLEPLAYPAHALAPHRPALIPLSTGGKRLHIAAQELGDSVSSAAGWLAGRLTFGNKKKKSRSAPEEAAESSAGASTTKEPLVGMDTDGQGVDLVFGVADDDGQGGDGATTAATELQSCCPPAAPALARVVGGGLLPPATGGGWASEATGRLDFAMQEASLEHQYLSALSAHFVYWASPDVALFVHRALRGLDVISGKQIDGGQSLSPRRMQSEESNKEAHVAFA